MSAKVKNKLKAENKKSMATIDKLKVFDSIENESAIIENIGTQSIKISLPCGCTNTQHFCSGKPKKYADVEKMQRLEIDRAFFVTLCDTHKI